VPLRPTSVSHPNGRRTHLNYGASSSTSDVLGRVEAIQDDNGGSPGETLVEYTYLGSGRIMVEDCVQPDVRRTYDSGTADTYAGLEGCRSFPCGSCRRTRGHSSQPWRYSRPTHALASGRLVIRMLTASHSIRVSTRLAMFPKQQISDSGPE
jgi:hypothetical protein